MKVLIIIPPHVPSYFNAGHHLPAFQVGAYLRVHTDDEVLCRDFGALNASWRDVCELLVSGFDVALLLNDFEGVDGFDRFVDYARKLAPGTRLATFGRASKQVPGFFERFGFDAIATTGDYEAAVVSWIRSLQGLGDVQGVRVREGERYVEAPPAGYLDPSEWVLPDVDEIPYAAYDRLYGDDLDKFCGVPGRRELVVPVARGCPLNCSFCDVPSMQGLIDRRLDPERVVDYIDESFSRAPFEYVSFYAPTFTLRRRWVLQLCDLLESRPKRLWKCVTTSRHLDRELVKRMAGAGCIRISIGVETLTPAAAKSLPLQKRDQRARIDELIQWCNSVAVELNCFLIMGLPGDDSDAARATVEYLLARQVRVRPTVLAPYERMTATMSVTEFASINRQVRCV